MSNRKVHIISFNIPYPPNYGGVIDVFYKLKYLSEQGIEIHLHCFQYGREHHIKLKQYCKYVDYYPRSKFYKSFYSKTPYIVGSRKSDELLSNVNEDDAPIIFEGLHTCFYLSDESLKNRIKLVRMHNVEWDYYRSLGKAERNFFRKFYFFRESKKLQEFQSELKHASGILAISKKDHEDLSQDHQNVHYIPAFHPDVKVNSKTGMGKYILYHGNLSVVENNQAAIYLLQKVMYGSEIDFVIAGRNPLSSLKSLVAKNPNTTLVDTPTHEDLQKLVTDAHINLLPTFQATGIKLKLLNALYNGRFCVVNNRMVQNVGVEELCYIENDSKKMRSLVEKLFNKEFEASEIQKRQQILDNEFSNEKNAKSLTRLLFP